MKVVIVISYFDRQFQLKKTLNSFTQTEHNDFEVIIIDDCSKISPNIAGFNFSIDLYKTQNKKWIGGAPALNLGISLALQRKADIILMQNSETYHIGDVISYADKIGENDYVSFASYCLSKENTFINHDIKAIIREHNTCATNNDDNAWFNHKTIRPMGYPWCAAIPSEKLKILNGFDERFSEAYCFEDDEFFERIKKIGMNIEITDFPFVVHQWHERSYVPKNWQQLFNINKNLFGQVQKNNNYRAFHKFTKDFDL